MCGRFSLVLSKEKIETSLSIKMSQDIQPSFNIAPTQLSYVITNENPTRLQLLHWGLLPHWSNDGKLSGKLINARTESISSKPSFRMPIRQKRCLVLADSFYEWKYYGQKKVPYRITMRNDDLMVMAGIWDIWQQGSLSIKSFSILTTLPNKEMELVHNRMPVIFSDKASQDKWLSDIPLDEVLSMPQVLQDKSLRIYRVSEKLNSVHYNDSELHHEVLEPPTLFD